MTMDKFSSGSNLDNPAIDVEMARLLSTVL